MSCSCKLTRTLLLLQVSNDSSETIFLQAEAVKQESVVHAATANELRAEVAELQAEVHHPAQFEECTLQLAG